MKDKRVSNRPKIKIHDILLEAEKDVQEAEKDVNMVNSCTNPPFLFFFSIRFG